MLRFPPRAMVCEAFELIGNILEFNVKEASTNKYLFGYKVTGFLCTCHYKILHDGKFQYVELEKHKFMGF